MDLKSQLQQVIAGEVLDDSETLKTFSKDASIFEIKPTLVISPKDSKDLGSIVKFINSHPDLKLSLTPRAAGTDMSGGAINDSLILDLMKHFNQTPEVGADYATAQPGVFYRDFEAETLKKNLLMPIYPASREICSVGGMVATNAGGELSLTYGSLSDFILELNIVLADGNEYQVKPLNKSELEKKMAQKDFEGQLYKKIFELITQNSELIHSSKPQTSKNSTGYFIWDVWDSQTFDLTKLILGSQGTLGIITEIKFRLIKPKSNPTLLLINLPSLDKIDQVINQVLKFKPESFECFDDETLKLAIRYSSELIKDFKHNSPLAARIGFLSLKLQSWLGTLPKFVLLANFTGNTEDQALAVAQQAQQSLKGLDLSSTILDNPAKAEKYWIIRHKSFNLLRIHAEDSQASSFIDDIIVNPEHLPEFLPQLNALLEPYKDRMHYTLAGHIGDGNFHIIPLMKLSDPKVREIIPEVMDKVFDLVFKYSGSMSAEHNDGLIRGPYLQKMYSPQMIKIFSDIKEIFDPKSIFNPHKKTQANKEYSFGHLRQS